MAAAPTASNLTEIERELVIACEGLLAEFDKLTRYGSPMAVNANEAAAFARRTVAKTRAQGRARP